MREVFWYEDDKGKHKITLKKACPEWCNSDCPTIFTKGNDGFTWRVNSMLVMEDSPWQEQFRKFVLASSKAFYRKYKSMDRGRNGFWENFLRENEVEA